ncbi:hypothetical protein HFO56_03470 [Rhizobium laguerreae]|uniref:hypothetical protein n=1 Tax=Rhizobium laguerreae TaxID=1076926 RepID=UPI001C918E79|nr:hypothetical protein [Rhizobium laguerreae]MBY3151448.1 hypothetical protein [Rhizobium laguerreae]
MARNELRDHLFRRAFSAGALKADGNGGIIVDDKGSPRLRGLLDKIGVDAEAGDRLAFSPEPDFTLSTVTAPATGELPITDYLAHEAMKHLATEAIERHWRESGGPKSVVGLPLGGKIDVKFARGAFQANFRSGKITFKNGVIEDVPGDWFRLYFTGLECVIRQESVDEVYGTVFCHAPGRGAAPIAITVPGGNEVFKMGPPGARVVLSATLLYEGPLVNITIGASLIENDSGDVEDISRNVADQIVKGGEALIGGLTGVPAEGITNETWYKEGIGKVVGVLLDDVFGIGDDPYLPAQKLVLWEQIYGFEDPQSYQRPGEPPVLQYHEILDVTGIDDAKDRGHYRFFFRWEHCNPPG